MTRSIGLAAYLAVTARAEGWANRTLTRRLAEGKEDGDRLDERRGHPSYPRPDGTVLWFHAASVGEALSIQELVRRLGEEDPTLNFLLTTGTKTSAAVLETRLPPRALHQYVPLDVRHFVLRFLDHWRPDLAIWTESELWPRLIYETHRRNIPMLLINARMSQRSHDRWRWMPRVAKGLLRRFTHILIQDQTTAEFLRRLGAPADRMETTGTLKEGTAALPCDDGDRDQFAKALKSRPVWLAASTHEGEEVIAAKAHKQALRSAHRLLLIIAPRHPERGAEIQDTLRRAGWSVARRAAGEGLADDTQIYIADTLGEMGLWYRVAPISLVAGSLVPVGGHNPFEPAALGSAILHGPHVTNFQDIYDRLAVAGAARCVTDAASLGAAVQNLLSPEAAASMAHAAWEVVSSGAEVTDRAVELILTTLEAGG